MAERRALLIGINSYPRLAERYQLHGCVHDAELMAGILRDNFGFPPGQVTLLREGQATREGILAALDGLVEATGEDDVVVIHFSGHGSQMRDREGDEPDGWDETIVPSDSGRSPQPNRDISDDEIYARLLRLTARTPNVTLLFDCCHSGTITRDAFGGRSRWLPRDERPRDELPPSPLPAELIPRLRAVSRDAGPSNWLPLGQRYVLLAGCRDEESSYEYEARQDGGAVVHGALTYFLAQELVQAPPRTTYRDVFERASARVTAVYGRQHPQMEGARDRELFGVRDLQPMRFVAVAARAGEEVTLAAGAAHGMTAGSLWAIYPQGTKQVEESTPCLGRAEIEAVRAVTAGARIVEEQAPGAIVAGSRAVEEAHSYGEMRLVVDLQVAPGHDEQAAQMRAALGASALLRLAGDGEPADVRIYLLAPRAGAGSGDPLPQVGAIAVPTWAVAGPDGRLAMPLQPGGGAGTAGRMRANLEKEARYRHVLALQNPDPGSELRGRVEFVLKRLGATGRWEKAVPEDESGQVVFREGDRIGITVTNYYRAPICVSILDLGLTGAINLLHPVEGAREKLESGAQEEIGIREGDEITLSMPTNFPYVPDPADRVPAGGTETFKLFATTQETDFSHLAQEGFRALRVVGARGSASPLAELLDLALSGVGTRDARRSRLPPDAEWTAVARTFTLRRR